MKAQTGIIITDYKSEAETEACLDSLAKVNGPSGLNIYVVKPEGKPGKVQDPAVVEILMQENLGYAAAVNAGIRQARTDGCKYLIVMNNDTTVDPDFINPLNGLLEKTGVGLVSPKIYFYPGREYHHDDYEPKERGQVVWYAGGVIDWQNIYAWHWGVNEVDHGQFTEAEETDFATGCCVAFKASLIDKIGWWDERYFLYLEDTDWSVRCARQGLKVMMEPKSVIWHKNAGSTGGSGSKTHVYYQTRNRVLFASKLASLKTKLHLYKQGARVIWQGSETEKKAWKAAMLKQWGKAEI